MATVQKFLFDRSFDDPDVRRAAERRLDAARARDDEAEHRRRDDGGRSGDEDSGEAYAGLDRRRRASDDPPPPPPDLYTAAQLEAAREEGYIKGHTAALEEAATADGHVSATALRTIAEAVHHMDAAHATHVAGLEKTATRLALAIARRLLPATAERVAAEELEHLVAHLLPDLMDQPRLVIRVHGALAETVRAGVRDLQTTSGYEGRIVVRPDNALGRADCRLEWGDGGVERDTGQLWEEIEAAVERHLREPVPPAPAAAPSATETPPAPPAASAPASATASATVPNETWPSGPALEAAPAETA
ncbi:FliH/SctL family protein [Roseospira goensis]|uniref:Flagellar assembly protein FliH n=1 Tax=Roseospira goensis TaxID=391922 RepID=A0A7W6WLB6_9PROT|nr:FliH/SctL family protein [Roseospira goensis]MBB4286965.1 flagellar assembly protein FliH [Roseospira goensis]